MKDDLEEKKLLSLEVTYFLLKVSLFEKRFVINAEFA